MTFGADNGGKPPISNPPFDREAYLAEIMRRGLSAGGLVPIELRFADTPDEWEEATIVLQQWTDDEEDNFRRAVAMLPRIFRGDPAVLEWRKPQPETKEPWKAAGVSRRTWYRRQKAAQAAQAPKASKAKKPEKA